MYIFAYGSLINLKSAANSLGTDIHKKDVILAYLNDYIRVWGVVDQVYSKSLQKEIDAVFLDVQEKKDSRVNGLLIPINQNQLNFIQKREKNYILKDISANIQTYDQSIIKEKIYTAISKKECRISDIEKTYYLLEYEKLVSDGLKDFDSSFEKEFYSSTKEAKFKKVAGEYNFIDKDQNKFA